MLKSELVTQGFLFPALLILVDPFPKKMVSLLLLNKLEIFRKTLPCTIISKFVSIIITEAIFDEIPFLFNKALQYYLQGHLQKFLWRLFQDLSRIFRNSYRKKFITWFLWMYSAGIPLKILFRMHQSCISLKISRDSSQYSSRNFPWDHFSSYESAFNLYLNGFLQEFLPEFLMGFHKGFHKKFLQG